MNRYIYSLYDSIEEEFSPLQTQICDDAYVLSVLHSLYSIFLSSSEEQRNELGPDFFPFVKKSEKNEVNPLFFERYSLYRVGIFEDSVGTFEMTPKESLSSLFSERLDELIKFMNSDSKEGDSFES